MQNNLLTTQMCNLQFMIKSIQETNGEERRRAEEGRQRTEEERQRAEEERRRAEEERQRAEERSILLQSKIEYSVDKLRNVLAKKIAPNRNKIRCLSLYKISENVWYIMRRQLESFNEGERKIYHKHPTAKKLCAWKDVAYAVDIGNIVKKQYRNCLRWDARGNVIKPTDTNDTTVVTDEEMLTTFERAINEVNDAHVLANNISV